MGPGIPRWATIVIAQAQPTALQTLPHNVVTSADAIDTRWLRMYSAQPPGAQSWSRLLAVFQDKLDAGKLPRREPATLGHLLDRGS